MIGKTSSFETGKYRGKNEAFPCLSYMKCFALQQYYSQYKVLPGYNP